MGDVDFAARAITLLRERPGLTTTTLGKTFGLDPSTVDYHLRRAAREGKVASQVVGRGRCWFAAGNGLCPFLRRAIPILHNADIRAVARALDATPAPASEVARRAGVDIGQARWALAALASLGALERSAAGLASMPPESARCVTNAIESRACSEWGTCPISRVWAARAEAAKAQAMGPLSPSCPSPSGWRA